MPEDTPTTEYQIPASESVEVDPAEILLESFRQANLRAVASLSSNDWDPQHPETQSLSQKAEDTGSLLIRVRRGLPIY